MAFDSFSTSGSASRRRRLGDDRPSADEPLGRRRSPATCQAHHRVRGRPRRRASSCLTSADDEYFIAHADVAMIAELPAQETAVTDGPSPVNQLLERLRLVPKLSIALVRGIARGGWLARSRSPVTCGSRPPMPASGSPRWRSASSPAPAGRSAYPPRRPRPGPRDRPRVRRRVGRGGGRDGLRQSGRERRRHRGRGADAGDAVARLPRTRSPPPSAPSTPRGPTPPPGSSSKGRRSTGRAGSRGRRGSCGASSRSAVRPATRSSTAPRCSTGSRERLRRQGRVGRGCCPTAGHRAGRRGAARPRVAPTWRVSTS